jgi:pimeloyl-ACP methyl ester carboxylesterase
MADDIHRLVRDTLKLGPLLVVGHDWGGSTAAAWAGAHPEDVRRLVVVEAQPHGPWSTPTPWFYAFHAAADFPEAMTAGPGFEFVRALPRDREANRLAALNPSVVPVLAIGGSESMGEGVASNLRPLFTDVRSVVLPNTGHFVPEEAADALVAAVLPFFDEVRDARR